MIGATCKIITGVKMKTLTMKIFLSFNYHKCIFFKSISGRIIVYN